MFKKAGIEAAITSSHMDGGALYLSALTLCTFAIKDQNRHEAGHY
jgi:hypothetical protein